MATFSALWLFYNVYTGFTVAKLSLTTIGSRYGSVDALNANFDAIEQAFQDVLYRDGSVPNYLEADIDMNGHTLLNLPSLVVGGVNISALNSALVWKGTWNSATTYAISDAVYYNGSSYICTAVNTNQAPPSASWDVLAAQGAVGAGSGDVVGPASSTTNNLAAFNSGTGKLLKDSAVPISSVLLTSHIGASVQAYSATTAKTDATQTFSVPQRGTQTTDNDLSFDLNTTNNFKSTPTAGGTLTFTNMSTATGQSGHILLVNGANYALSAAATTKINASTLSIISGTGTYLLAYYCDGTNVYVTASSSLA
jgi:hypothetical protein